MILISFLAIAEDTTTIEKELFRATVIFKNDHETYKQYLIIVESNDKTITPKFKKLFYNKALEFNEYNSKFKHYILLKCLSLPDVEKNEMLTYIETYKNIVDDLSEQENNCIIELFLKRLSLQFLEDNLIQEFTSILFKNFTMITKLTTKEDYDVMIKKFKNHFPELIVRLSLHVDQYEDDYDDFEDEDY